MFWRYWLELKENSLRPTKLRRLAVQFFKSWKSTYLYVCEFAYKSVTLSATVLEILWRLALKFLKVWKSNTLSGDCPQKLETLKDWKNNQQCFEATGQEFWSTSQDQQALGEWLCNSSITRKPVRKYVWELLQNPKAIQLFENSRKQGWIRKHTVQMDIEHNNMHLQKASRLPILFKICDGKEKEEFLRSGNGKEKESRS